MLSVWRVFRQSAAAACPRLPLLPNVCVSAQARGRERDPGEGNGHRPESQRCGNRHQSTAEKNMAARRMMAASWRRAVLHLSGAVDRCASTNDCLDQARGSMSRVLHPETKRACRPTSQSFAPTP
eukprot:scaffold66856_cov29-Tisochrysis_lutea.AAC.3